MKTLIIFMAIYVAKAEDCVWNKDTDFPEYPSLLMNKDTWQSILPVLQGSVREVRIAAGTTVVVACPETLIIATKSEVVEGVCEGGSVLNVGGSKYDMMDLGCQSRPLSSIKKYLGSCGYDDAGDEHAIGFNVEGYNFYELIRVCFYLYYETTLYTTHLLRGESISGSDSNPSRPSFKTDTGFFTVSPNNCYSVDNQELLMEELLIDPNVIDYSSSLFFARGHLAPDADFLTDMESDATYYYINVVPQWQIFNNGNWKALEMSIRDLASSHGTDFKIWTGTWNILELMNEYEDPVEIFLGYTEYELVIPAPDLMWKVIYEPSTDRGVAVVGVNNPYVTEFPTPLCSDICDQIPWIDFDVNNLLAGATYCCTVQDFYEAVPDAPDLGSAGLLIN